MGERIIFRVRLHRMRGGNFVYGSRWRLSWMAAWSCTDSFLHDFRRGRQRSLIVVGYGFWHAIVVCRFIKSVSIRGIYPFGAMSSAEDKTKAECPAGVV